MCVPQIPKSVVVVRQTVGLLSSPAKTRRFEIRCVDENGKYGPSICFLVLPQYCELIISGF